MVNSLSRTVLEMSVRHECGISGFRVSTGEPFGANVRF
jgi:hypothetical protein